MGMFFKNTAKITKEIEVDGQKFLLTRPNAKGRVDFMESYQTAYSDVTDLTQSRIAFEMNCLLVAFFVQEQPEFEGKTVNEVAQIIVDEADDYDVINDLADACWEMFNLKTDGSLQETDSSPED